MRGIRDEGEAVSGVEAVLEIVCLKTFLFRFKQHRVSGLLPGLEETT